MKDNKGVISQYKGLPKEVYAACIGIFVTMAGFMTMPILTLFLQQKLGLSAFMISFFVGLDTFMSLIASIAGGKLADKFPKRNVIVVCDLISVFFAIIAAILPISIYTAICMIMISCFQAVELPAYNTIIADVTKKEECDIAYSLFYLAFNIGYIITPTIAGLLFNTHFKLIYIITAIAIFLSSIVIYKHIKSSYVEIKNTNINNTFHVFKNNKLLILYLIIICFYEVIYSGNVSYFFPFVIGKTYPQKSSLLFGTMMSINCVLVLLLTPILTRCFHNKKHAIKLVLGSYLTFISSFIFLFSNGCIPVYYLSIIFLSLGEIIITLAYDAYLMIHTPEEYRGRVYGMVAFITKICVMIFTLLFGILYEKQSLNMIILFFVILFITFTFISSVFLKKDIKGVIVEN